MERIGKYEIIEELGQGGMGVVYKARDPVIGRHVAIKMVQERILNLPEVRQRFYREAKSAGRLSHENITTLYDVGEEGETPYLVMEFLGGTDLGTLLHRGHDFTLREKISIAVQIARGLQYAHQQEVIHRDIKPDNIRVLEDHRVKIMDFGIARLDAETRTLTNKTIGTPRYMSPEQIKGEKIDHRTDIFSFGVVFFELLTGNPPFPGDHVTAVIYKILHEEPVAFDLDDTPLSDDLQHVIARCLEKDPERRYADFGAVLHDLAALLSSTVGPTRTLPGVHASSASLSGAVSSPSQPVDENGAGRGRLAALGGVVILVLAVGGYVTFGWMRSSNPLAAASSSDSGRAQQEDPSSRSVETRSPPDSAPLPLVQKTTPDADTPPPTGSPDPPLPSERPSSSDEASSDVTRPSEEAPAATPSAASSDPPPSEPTESSVRRQAADRARVTMDRARQQIADQEHTDATTSLFERAQSLRETGRRQYEAGRFADATRSFRAAESLYVRTEHVLENVRTVQRAAADARTQMRTAKDEVQAALREHERYEKAQRLEATGDRAYTDERFDDAQTHYQQAAVLYRTVAASQAPEEQVRQAVRELALQCKQAFEREDLEALRALSTFYGSWAEFFELADDITLDIRPDAVDVVEDRATATLHFRIAYRDNKNREQQNTFSHQWTLARQGGTWELTQVVAQ